MQFFIKKPSFILYRIISLCLLLLFLQSCGVSSRIKKADSRFELGEYYAAGDLYKSSYGRIPYKDKSLRGYVAFRQGECFRLINNQRAEQAYLNAIRNNFADSTVFLRYAQVLHRNGKYGEALRNYQLYLQKDSSSIIAKIQLLMNWFLLLLVLLIKKPQPKPIPSPVYPKTTCFWREKMQLESGENPNCWKEK